MLEVIVMVVVVVVGGDGDGDGWWCCRPMSTRLVGVSTRGNIPMRIRVMS